MRKDIKKSSYYVWFLGAQEAKGLRGPEYVLPVVRSLVEREREVEPFKVTLQVSHKGLKIVQNVPGSGGASGAAAAKGATKVLGAKPAKAETVKHLIPHHAVTCVLQQEDIVACILLLYNPVTKCPVHVHAYRCDSVETAQILCGQLQTLIERPDNQKKLAEIEARLRTKGLLGGLPPGPRRAGQGHSPGSDGRSTRESESSGGSSSERLSGGFVVREERVTNLYDSLAAELREKLGADTDATHAPILLPPRDYDTVHRQKGNLASVDRRRCLNASIVGVNIKNSKNNALEEEPAAATAANGRHAGKRGSAGSGGAGVVGHPAAQTSRGPGGALVGSSGGSSGIGSDHAPSPDNESDPRYLDNASSSDEEWNEEPSEDSLFLVQPGRGAGGALSGWRGSHASAELSLPRARRVHSPAASPSPTSPAAPGSLGRDLRDHPLAAPLPASAAPGPRRRHASPTSPLDRHHSREEEEELSRTRVRRPPADERQRAPRSPRSSPRSPRSPRAVARSPQRSLSPPPHRAAPGGGPGGGSAPHGRKGAPQLAASSLASPMSPRERFQDAKEKFLSLERERLEEQERVMQLNLEKRRSGPQQPPLQHQQSAPQSPHSPPIVEPPISPAMGPCPRPRPRPRRPSWSRSRDDSEDEVPDSGNHHASRYYPDDDEDDDVDFSGNALPTGGRQRIIAAVNRRMSRESLEDDVDDFAPQPTRSAPTSRSGPPRHEYPAGYRGGDVPARSDHPARDHPGRDHPVRDHPVREHPVRDHPNRDHPSRDHPTRDHPARDHPTRDHPTRDHPNRDHPTREHPAREHPIREHSGRDQIPRVEHPNRGDHSSRGDHPARSDNPARPDHPVRDLPGRDYPGREPPVRDHPSRDHPGRDHPTRGEHPSRDPPSRGSGGDLRAAVSRSRSVHRDRALEDRFRSPARGYPYPMEPLMDEGQRYRIPYNEDMDIPLERYRSSNNPQPRPPGPPLGPPLGPRHPYPREHDDDEPPHPRGDPRAYLADKKRRSVFEALEEERRRHSNELAQEFKRRSYQELDERERYPGLDRETAREPGPPGPPPGHRTQVSARYRHSYAEPPPRHHDLLHRANSAASSPRVGIAAVHPY